MDRLATMVLAAVLALGTTARAQVGAVWGVHDPCVIKADGAYYVFSTGPGIPVRRSRDLYHWERVGRVFEKNPDWFAQEVPGSNWAWAPDISRAGGTYFLYYSVSTFGSNRSRIGLATNVTLDPSRRDYRWVDLGPVIGSNRGDDWNAIDPNLVDVGGRPWLAFGSFWSGIKLERLDPDRTRPAADSHGPIALAARTTHEIEAPFLVNRAGWFFLFASVDRCCRGVDSTYKVIVGRAREVTGPYVDRRGRKMTEGGGTLVVVGSGRMRGPGHNAVLHDGPRDWFVHHYYDADAFGQQTLLVRPLLWSADGWPLAGEPIEGPVDVAPSAGTTAVKAVGRWRQTVGDRGSTGLTLLASGRLEGPGSTGTWQIDGQALTLRWTDPRTTAVTQIDECALSADGRWYVGRTPRDELIHGVRIGD